VVTSVEIDAAGAKVVHADNTQVSGLKNGSQIGWMQADAALPMPLDSKDEVMALALKASDFVKTLNQQPLKVTGLSAARYALKIDQTEVGTFTKEQLAEGVNLALLTTPMAKQAADVHKLTLQHNNTHFARWRQVQVPLASYKSDKVQN